MPVDPLIDRYRLPQVILPVDPDDIANKAYVDARPAPILSLLATLVAATDTEVIFTPTTPLDMVNDFSEIYCVIKMDKDGGDADFEMRLNQDVSASYDKVQNSTTGAANTPVTVNDVTILDIGLRNGGHIIGQLHIIEFEGLLMYNFHVHEGANYQVLASGALDTPAQTTLSELRFSVSDGTMTGRVFVYGLST